MLKKVFIKDLVDLLCQRWLARYRRGFGSWSEKWDGPYSITNTLMLEFGNLEHGVQEALKFVAFNLLGVRRSLLLFQARTQEYDNSKSHLRTSPPPKHTCLCP